jgi:antitoxin (DNA-binding transcriptional repressor) of toxin-antitoxin stability system
MSYTATEFRKNLFSVLERVAHGETVEMSYKTAVIRLSVQDTSSKLARGKRQHALLVDPDSIVHSDDQFLREVEREAERDWAEM